MTTRHPEAADQKRRERFVLPDPPEGEPEDMTSFDHLAASGNVRCLIRHFGNPGTTIVAGERYLTRAPGAPARDRMAPDLLIAMGADQEAYQENNGYIISEQGKPPDFVLEIASRSTGRQDAVEKRAAYAGLGIPEYWRFDETGEFHGTRLAADRLVDGRYEPIPVEEPEEGILEGYSSVLNLIIRWEHGELGWHDPETGDHIVRLEDLEAQRDEAQARADEAQAQRDEAQAQRDEAQARIRELEAALERRRQV